MLDQSFSVKNFKRIIDLENRKGVYLEGEYFSNIKKITEKIKQCNYDIRVERKKKVKTANKLEKLYEKRKSLKQKKEGQLDVELQKISEKIVSSSYKIELDKKNVQNGKPLYIVKDSPEHYFTMKQIQNNVSRLFGVKQSNRFEIVNQVKILLNDEFPKYVLKTDINDFYENIPHENLLKKINGNNLLTPFSRRILRQILNIYNQLSGSQKGIPRGVGVSAHLAELYMRDIDNEIMSLAEIIYYARYVDDIIVIFAPTPNTQGRDCLEDIKEIIETKFKLKLNDAKTFKFDLRNTKQACELEYLGYKFFFGDGKIKTKLTDKKIKKYKNRIDLAFDHYSNLSKINEKEARMLLVKRLRFLTGNTRLKNNKKNILVGIYYSNCQLTEITELVRSDDYLRTKINLIQTTRLQERLKKYSFKIGFETRRFSPFKTYELQKIMQIWK